jgi:flagellum-specific ATP synthase
MRLGDCVIETELGSVDLGIRAQLGEIERGFFDRAGGSQRARPLLRAARPGRRASSGPGGGAHDALLARYFARLERGQPWRWRGQVLESVGQTIESAGPLASVGECCEIRTSSGRAAPGRGDRISRVECACRCRSRPRRDSLWRSGGGAGRAAEIEVGPALMGRVLNALGEPIDEGRPPRSRGTLPLDGAVRSPARPRAHPHAAGHRHPRARRLLTVGRGQRVGIFGGSGVGKSTLIGMMTRNTEADVTVVGLVGERGREVGEFLEDSLGVEGRARSVVVVSTSDQSPLMRMRAALAATTVAEFFAAQGKHVLLVLDSLTRFAMAAREIGLAAGEPPTAKGYTPSVFTRLARLVERAGQFRVGSITAFYTVLMEGDDQQDPLVDAVRSLLDGHMCALARAGRRGLVSAGRGAGLDQPADAGGDRSPSIANRPRCCAS